jgi:hypothetical protein
MNGSTYCSRKSWQTGEYDWIQCPGLHDQNRPRMLQAAWKMGGGVEQPGIFAKVMRRHIMEKMWLKYLKKSKQIRSHIISHIVAGTVKKYNCENLIVTLTFRICSLWKGFFSSYVLVFLI